MNTFYSLRTPGKRKDGSGFSKETVEAVWQKGTPIPGLPAYEYRKDYCGATMKRSLYGETVKYGWEIDHIRPVSKGGGDDLSNLQPLQWENNRHKGDDYPYWTCKIRQ